MPGKLFSGNRLTQAVLAAARHFHLDPDQVAYVERTKTSGHLGSPRVVIEVDPAAPQRTAAPAAPAAPIAAPSVRVAAPPPPPRATGASPRPMSRLSETRERELRELATAAVDAVRATGEPVLLSELNPAERRIIHTTVSELGLSTESQGEERYKRILVRLGQAAG